MKNFNGNSYAEKRNKTQEAPAATVKKQSGVGGFFKNLFVDNIQGAIKRTMEDTLKPRVQETLYKTIDATAKNMIYGDKPAPTDKKPSVWGVRADDRDYTAYSKGEAVAQVSGVSVEDITFRSKSIASVILQMMKEEISRCGYVRVGDYYDMVIRVIRDEYHQELDIRITSEDYNFGWRDLSMATIVPAGWSGAYYIRLPKVVMIKR